MAGLPLRRYVTEGFELIVELVKGQAKHKKPLSRCSKPMILYAILQQNESLFPKLQGAR